MKSLEKKCQKRIASKGNFPLNYMYISIRGSLVHPLHLTLFNLVISTENCSLYQISFIDKF